MLKRWSNRYTDIAIIQTESNNTQFSCFREVIKNVVMFCFVQRRTALKHIWRSKVQASLLVSGRFPPCFRAP